MPAQQAWRNLPGMVVAGYEAHLIGQETIMQETTTASVKRVSIKTVAAALAIALTGVAIAGPSVYPDGTTRYDPTRAENDFVIFTGGDNIARLIDLNGQVVKQWKDAGILSTLLDPALTGGQRGHVLVTLDLEKGNGLDLVPGRMGNQVSKTIGEQDWNGNTVWRFGPNAPSGTALQHHDWARLVNGNTLVLANLVHAVPGSWCAMPIWRTTCM
jgi:hypothetical protein